MGENTVITVDYREESITLKYKDRTETCTIREMTGGAAEQHMEANKNNFEFEVDESGFRVTGVKSFKGIYSSILKHTLFHEDGKLFTEKEIDALPATVQKKLFAVSQEINGLTEESRQKLKNE